MNYRVLQISSGSPAFMERVLAKVPESDRTYNHLLQAFIDERFGWSDYFIQWCREHGHLAEMVACNFEVLQKAWAAENDLKYDESHWAQQILLAQLKALKPDVVWIHDLYFISADMRRAMRDLLPGVLLLGWRFATTRDMGVLRDLDLIITGAEAYAEEFRECGIRAEVVNWCFAESIYGKVQPVKRRALPFIFCGTLGKPEGHHSIRYRTIDKLLSRTPLEVFSVAPSNTSCSFWWKLLLRMSPSSLKECFTDRLRYRIPFQAIYADRFHDAMFGLDYFRLLANTQICFNVHIDMAVGFAGNLRMFEASGMGACLLTDWKPNMKEYFEPDFEVVVYHTPEEAVEKANYLLSHPKEREIIAERGRQRALRDHTLTSRMEKMNEIISQALKR